MKSHTFNKLKSKSNVRIYYLIIVIIGFILYGQSINNNFNIDDDYVYENHQLVKKGISGIPEIFKSRYNTRDEQYFGYRPLTIAIYAIEYEIYGMNPHMAHFFNILYYIISCCLLFYLLKLLLKSKFPDGYIWISFLIVLIFQTHAIHTEVVLSIKNREEIISLILSLIACIAAIKFFDSRKAHLLIIGIVSLGLAFLAKESAIVFAVLIPLMIVFFKTELKFMTQIVGNFNFNLKSFDSILKLILVFWIILFIFLSGNLKLYGDINIKINSFDFDFSEIYPWLFFITTYTYILIRNRKKGTNSNFNKRNIVLWSLSIVLITISIILDSELFALFVLLILFLTLVPVKTQGTLKIKWIENLSKRSIYLISAFVILSGIVLSLTYYIPKQSLPETNAPVYKWQNPSFTTNSSSDKAAVAIYSLGYYAKLSLIPYPLRFYYGYKMVPEVKMSDSLVIISLLIHLFLIFIALRGFNKRSLLSFGILFYFIAIFPFANTFFPLTGVIAERLLFVPSIGVSIIAVFFLMKILKLKDIAKGNKSIRNKSLILATIIIIPNSLVSLKRNDDWKDRETLFAHDIQYLENSAKANTLYANLLIGEVYNAIKQKQTIENYRNQVEIAVKHFTRAAEIDSTYSNPWHNLGYINMILYKNYELAALQFSQSIKVDSTVAASFLNRGISNFYLKNYKQSIADLTYYVDNNKNIEDKEFDKAFVFTAKSNLELGDTLSATNYYILALENLKMQNLNKAVIDDIRNHFLLVQRFDLAIKVSDLEISFNPDIDAPYVDKGNYYLLSGDTINAVKNWEIAFEKFNGNFNIGMTLQQYFTEIGDIDKANYYYTKAYEFRQKQQGL